MGEATRQGVIPEGTFDGTVHGPLWLRLLARVWQGKVFTGDQVTNRILGRQLIRGTVRVDGEIVAIDYPRLHLTDELIDLFGDGSRWAGTLRVWRYTVHF